MKPIRYLPACLVLWANLVAGAATNDLTATLQKGLFEEEANHNLGAAMQAYQEVIARFDKDRKLAATAIFRLGECYRKQGNTNEASAQYERILREFPDQVQLATLSRQNLPAPSAQLSGAGGESTNEGSTAARFGAALEAQELARIRATMQDSPDLINARDSNGQTPLHRAAVGGQVTVAQFLLANGADVDSRDQAGATPLSLAVGIGNKAMVEVLLAAKANVNEADNQGLRPLHRAAQGGFQAVADVLIGEGADVNAASKTGATPLHLASANGFRSMTQMLLGKGADVNANAERVSVRNTSYAGTPLHIAVLRDDRAMAELLLANKANVNAVSPGGFTPLHFAARDTDPAFVELLLQHGAKVDVKDGEGWTPLHRALVANRADIVTLLLKRKADPDAQFDVSASRPGWAPTEYKKATPLFYETYTGNTNLMQILLGAKADPNLRTASGSCPILTAAALGNAPALALLLDGGALIDARDQDGNTALHIAVKVDCDDCIRLLVAHHADVNARDNSGNTPLHFAVWNQRRSAAEFLLEHGAEPNLVNNEGKTPLDLTRPASDRPMPMRPGPPPPLYGLQTPSSTAKSSGPADLGTLLREHGAIPDLPLPDRIAVRRPDKNYRSDLFFKSTNDWNQFSLLETIAAQYRLLAANPTTTASSGYTIGAWAGDQLPFPDFAKLRIRRLAPDRKSWQQIAVDLTPALNAGDCSKDLPLRWGDIVEIPEADHVLGQSWRGFPDEVFANLAKCLSRQVQVIIKGQSNNLTLTLGQQRNPAGKITSLQLDESFWIRPALRRSDLLLSSCDLSRVKVTRRDPATGESREIVVDCSDAAPSPALWLREGDIIQVPEKP